MSSEQPSVVVTRPRRRRSWRLAAVLVVGIVLAVVGCRTLDLGPVKPPSAVVAPAEAVAHEVRGLAGVASVDVKYSRLAVGPHEQQTRANSPSKWRMTLTVVMDDRTEAGPFAALGRDLVEVVQRHPAEFQRVVWLRNAPPAVVPSLAVQVLPAPDVDRAVESAFALAGTVGVLTVDVSLGTASVSVLRASDVAAAASAASALDVGLTSVSTADGRASADASVGILDERILGFTAEVASWESVTRARFSAGPGLVGERLKVDVAGGTSIRGVADRLGVAPDARDTGKPVAFTVSGHSGRIIGYVGESSVAPTLTPTRATPGPTASAGEWPDDPAAPACTSAALAVQITGVDYAMGSRWMSLTATNESGRACAVQARPEVEFGRVSGTTTPNVTVVPMGVSPVEPKRIVVPVGAAVCARLEWGAMSMSKHSDPTATVSVRAFPGATLDILAVDSRTASGADTSTEPVPTSLDILDGAKVQVSPWLTSFDQ